MPGPDELEKIKGWETLGPRSKKDDLGAMVKAIKAVGEAEVTGVTVDVDHVVAGGQHGADEGVDDSGRLIITENAPVEGLIDESLDREAWKAKGAPSKARLFFRRLLEHVPFLARMLQPMKRKAKTRHEYVLRHDGYKRIHKL